MRGDGKMDAPYCKLCETRHWGACVAWAKKQSRPALAAALKKTKAPRASSSKRKRSVKGI
jgi:hypothetical protein